MIGLITHRTFFLLFFLVFNSTVGFTQAPPDTPSVPAAQPAAVSVPSTDTRPESANTSNSSTSDDGVVNTRNGSFYLPRYRFSKGLAPDGFPIRNESFVFTDEEARLSNNLAVVKKALKREQRRLTKIYFSEHPFFKSFKPSALKELVAETSEQLDNGIDAATSIAVLSNFSYENFRNHLLRVSSYITVTKHLALTNPTGAEKESFLSAAVPHRPAEYAAYLGLFLSLLLGGYVFFINPKS